MPGPASKIPSPNDRDPTAQVRARVTGLSVACPYGQDNPATCPLHQLRQQPLAERYAWVRTLRPEQLESLLGYHCTCLQALETAPTRSPADTVLPSIGK